MLRFVKGIAVGAALAVPAALGFAGNASATPAGPTVAAATAGPATPAVVPPHSSSITPVKPGVVTFKPAAVVGPVEAGACTITGDRYTVLIINRSKVTQELLVAGKRFGALKAHYEVPICVNRAHFHVVFGLARHPVAHLSVTSS